LYSFLHGRGGNAKQMASFLILIKQQIKFIITQSTRKDTKRTGAMEIGDELPMKKG
jgi:hypothetical protein